MSKAVDTVRSVGKSIDPTTSGGLANIATGGLYELGKGPVSDGWDKLTGKEQQEELEAALKRSEDAQLQQIGFMREQYGDIKEGLAPYREAGAEFLPQLQELLSPEAKQSFISDYLQGDEYQQLQGQASQQLLQSAAATGGLGASGTQDRLARQTLQMGSQLGNQAYGQAIGNLTQGTNLGLGTFGTQLQAQGQLNQGVNQGLSNIANAQIGAASMNQGGILGQLAPFAPVVGAFI